MEVSPVKRNQNFNLVLEEGEGNGYKGFKKSDLRYIFEITQLISAT